MVSEAEPVGKSTAETPNCKLAVGVLPVVLFWLGTAYLFLCIVC